MMVGLKEIKEVENVDMAMDVVIYMDVNKEVNVVKKEKRESSNSRGVWKI